MQRGLINFAFVSLNLEPSI